MNNGLVTGTIFYPSGKRASNVIVNLTSVLFGSGPIPISGTKHSEGGFSWRSTDATTDSNGRFTVPFFWSGAEFASDISTITINLVAFNNRNGATTASKKWSIRGYL